MDAFLLCLYSFESRVFFAQLRQILHGLFHPLYVGIRKCDTIKIEITRL